MQFFEWLISFNIIFIKNLRNVSADDKIKQLSADISRLNEEIVNAKANVRITKLL